MINSKRLVGAFFDLVKIDSETGKEKKVRKFLEKKLLELGLDVAVDKKGNIYAILQGKKQGVSLMFSAHMDTVSPGKGIIPRIEGDKIISKENTILGADDKSGIAIILEMFNVIKENNLLTNNIVAIFTVEEEIGLLGAKSLQPIQVDYGFVLDTGGDIGTVIVKTPTHYSFSAKIIGKTAHAGIEPEKGLNAIFVAAKAISACKFGRIDKDTVCNIGKIKGGGATNIVPDIVSFKGEVRSLSNKKVKHQLSIIEETFNSEVKGLGAQLIFKKKKEYKSFDVSNEKKILELCKSASEKIGIPHIETSSGGGSDANIFNEMRIPTVVLSTGMKNVHTINEEIKISDMVKATAYILSIIKKATKSN
jgi:tripeptide aminopeptidase